MLREGGLSEAVSAAAEQVPVTGCVSATGDVVHPPVVEHHVPHRVLDFLALAGEEPLKQNIERAVFLNPVEADDVSGFLARNLVELIIIPALEPVVLGPVLLGNLLACGTDDFVSLITLEILESLDLSESSSHRLGSLLHRGGCMQHIQEEALGLSQEPPALRA